MKRGRDPFGHPPGVVARWRALAGRALRAGARTPFYLFDAAPVAERVAELDALDLGKPSTAWLSCKTQPLPALLRWWRRQGRPAEVVSGAELAMALDAGFAPEAILANGPAKHRWLASDGPRGMRVHFDGPAELAALAPVARRRGWKVGLRVRMPYERDPEDPAWPSQFGFEPGEIAGALRALRRHGLEADSAHFHLRTNVPSPSWYRDMLAALAELCGETRWQPRFVDVGGGLPPRHTLDRAGRRCDAGHRGSTAGYARALRGAAGWFPRLEGWWHEHGRFVSAGSGVLVVTVLDARRRGRMRQLVCDGGRTMNALVSLWERHALHPLSPGRGPRVPTTVHGPTCMVFDQLARGPMPASLRAGDRLLWFEAGAYHLPWETRFSHPLAGIWWHEDGRLACERQGGTGR